MHNNMKRQTFLIGGVTSLIIVLLGFVALMFLVLMSYILIALGAIIFWLVLRKAKKEDWFGKPAK